MAYRHKSELTQSKLRSAISNGKYTLPEVDHRSAFMRRLRDLIHDLSDDLGGERGLSTAELILVRRAAMLTVQVEMMEQRWVLDREGAATPRQLISYGRSVNTLKRVLEVLGVQARFPTMRIINPSKKEMSLEDMRARLRELGLPTTVFDPPLTAEELPDTPTRRSNSNGRVYL